MLEAILRFTVERRVLVVLLTLLAAGVGVLSLARLPIDAVPDVTNNQVQINTEYASLGPEQIELQVTFPIETALAGIESLDYTRSISRNGFSQVTAVFEDDVDVYFARSQVLERLTTVGDSLPPEAEPTMGPISTGLGEVYMYAVAFDPPLPDGEAFTTPGGDVLTTLVEKAAYLRTLQEFTIAPQLRQVDDVAGVDSIGGYAKQFGVEPDPTRLSSYGLSMTDLVEALEANNRAVGATYVEENGEAFQVRASGLLGGVEDIAAVVVKREGGTLVRVSDVADVRVGGEVRYGSASVDGEEAVIGTALMLIGGNSRTVAADVAERLEAVNATLPEGVVARPLLDRTKLVDETIDTVRHNLFFGAILVIAVLFALLGNLRAAVLTSLAIPLSMLLTATGMVQSGITANLMSLGAIDFGIIIDGSVIIVENCVRRLAERQRELGRVLTTRERLEVVFEATKQVRGATVFGELIIIVVYVPVLFLTGVEGKMFFPMAATVIFALVAAFVLSFTFVPAAVALVMRGKVSEKEVFVIRGAKAAYEPVVRAAVRFRWPVVGVAAAAFVGSLFLFAQLGQEFVPQLDEGDLAVQALRMPSTSLTSSQALQSEFERRIAAIPEVGRVFSKTGTAEVATDPMPPNISDAFVILKEKDQWRPTAEIIAALEELEAADADPHGHGDHGHDHGDLSTAKDALTELIRRTAAAVPGAYYEFSQPIELRFNELISGVRSDVAVKVFGDDFDAMVPAAERIAAVLASVPGASGVSVEQVEGLPILDVRVDREAAGRYGLTVAAVQDVVAAAIGGREAGVVFDGDRRFDVVVRLPEAIRGDVTTLAELSVPLPTYIEDAPQYAGLTDAAPPPPPLPFVPLSEVATVEVREGLNQVSRENGKRRVVVTANVVGRDLGSFVEEARERIASDAPPPPGTYLDFGGQFENLERAKQRLLVVVPLCFVLIFVLLYATFGSAKYAAMVFVCVPLALTGGVVALWLRGMPFSISAAVGFIALSGVAVLNGLVMVTFINQRREEGEQLEDAIIGGSVVRLRPVLMTALVAALGFVPMAIATGSGAEVQKPLATVVIGGILSAAVLTLVVLPAVYRLWNRPEAASQDATPRTISKR